MPNIKSSEKRMRTSRERAARNRGHRSSMKTAIKKVSAADTPEDAERALREATVLIDRAAARRLIHRNKAARAKRQLAQEVSRKS
ncbi:MAG: 30S ribosomal protein S20 [Longimicrobiaceae bacterium]